MTPAELFARGRRLLGSVSWATADQVLSALSNILITLAVVRGSGAGGLGQFSVAFAAYLTALGFSRSIVSDPLLTAPRGPDDRAVERSATTLTLLYALLAAAATGLVGLLLEHRELLVMACVLPVPLVHDLLRYRAFRQLRPQLAAVLDGGWVAGSLLAWPVVSSSPSPVVGIWCWAGAALLGIVAALPLMGAGVTRVGAAVRWWRRDCRPVAPALVLDSILITVLLQVLVFVVVSTEGDTGLGLLRAAQVFFSPLGIALTAIGVLAVPRLVARGGPPTAALAFRLSAGLMLLAGLVCGVIVLAEPVLHAVLFADTVDVPGWLMAPLVVQTIAAAGASGLLVATKARRRGGDLARSRLVSSAVGVAVLVPATHAFGLRGAAWALAVQGLVYLADQAFRVSRSGRPAVAGPDLAGPDVAEPATVSGRTG